MDKFWEFLKKNWIAVVGCVFAALFSIVGVPLLINWAYSVPAWCDFFAVDWEAKEALDYYGSALGFIGTVIFSGLALWQNHKIQEANDAHTQLLEQMERDKVAPCITVSAVGHGNASTLTLMINNLSDNIAENVYASGFAIIDETGAAQWRDETVKQSAYLYRGRVWEIKLKNPQITNKNHQVIFEIKYKDTLGGNHTCKAVGSFGQTINVPSFKLTEIK